MINNHRRILLLIPAAGAGTRSGLNFPKSLYKIKNIPIIVRIINKLNIYSNSTSLVINKKDYKLFNNCFDKYKIPKIEYLYQNNPTGMGDAILKVKKSKNFNKIDDILLIWSDIPFISKKSIDKLIKNHYQNDNFMTLLSAKVSNPYTYIKKDLNNNVLEIEETHYTKKKYAYGERDIGVFIFKKDLIKHLQKKTKNGEHNFLYVIKKLYKKSFSIKALDIASKKETISLNYLSDINI